MSRKTLEASRAEHAGLMAALSEAKMVTLYEALTPIQRNGIRTMVRVLMGDNEAYWPQHIRDKRVTAGGKFKGRPRSDKK